MIIPNSIIKSMFANVYFITGTAYAGKSTAVKLLSEHFDGICCGENFHDIFMKHIDRENQPNLSYFDTMKDWQEFVNRTPVCKPHSKAVRRLDRGLRERSGKP